MDAAEIAAELTLALIEKTPQDAMISDRNDKQSSAKWVGKTFETILIGVVAGIKEANKQR
jgi:hypothetical protein